MKDPPHLWLPGRRVPVDHSFHRHSNCFPWMTPTSSLWYIIVNKVTPPSCSPVYLAELPGTGLIALKIKVLWALHMQHFWSFSMFIWVLKWAPSCFLRRCWSWTQVWGFSRAGPLRRSCWEFVNTSERILTRPRQLIATACSSNRED